MKKTLILFFILVCTIATVSAQDQYKITKIYNASSITIDGVECRQGYIFKANSKSKIHWPNNIVAFHAINTKTGQKRYFDKKCFEKTKSISIFEFLKKVVLRRTCRARRTSLNPDDLRSIVEDSTFYIQDALDTLFIQSPMPINEGYHFAMDYYKGDEKIRCILPSAEYVIDENTKETAPFLIITRSMFTEENDLIDYKVTIRFVTKYSEGEGVIITDRMNIVCLPYEPEDNDN